jgi:hypothetical protein
MNKDINRELEELSPLLARLKKEKEITEMPDNYFHYLENSLMQQVQLENIAVLKVDKKVSISFWNRFFSKRTISGLASGLLLVVGWNYFNQIEISAASNSLQFSELTDAEILNYLTDNAEALDIYSLSELDEDDSILDMIDFEEGDVEYLLNENATDIFSEELF